MDEWSFVLSEKAQQQANEVENLLHEDARSLSRDIYKDLEKEYEWLPEDKQVAKTIRSNDLLHQGWK